MQEQMTELKETGWGVTTLGRWEMKPVKTEWKNKSIGCKLWKRNWQRSEKWVRMGGKKRERSKLRKLNHSTLMRLGQVGQLTWSQRRDDMTWSDGQKKKHWAREEGRGGTNDKLWLWSALPQYLSTVVSKQALTQNHLWLCSNSLRAPDFL